MSCNKPRPRTATVGTGLRACPYKRQPRRRTFSIRAATEGRPYGQPPNPPCQGGKGYAPDEGIVEKSLISGAEREFSHQPAGPPRTPGGMPYGFRTSRTMWLISGRMIFSIPVRQAFPEPGSVMMMVSRQVPAVARVSMAAVPMSSKLT